MIAGSCADFCKPSSRLIALFGDLCNCRGQLMTSLLLEQFVVLLEAFVFEGLFKIKKDKNLFLKRQINKQTRGRDIQFYWTKDHHYVATH